MRFLICSMVTCALISTPARAEGPYKTPEEVFAAAKSLALKEDYKGFCGCLTEKGREQYAGMLAFGAVLTTKFASFSKDKDDAEAKAKPLRELLDKYGITDEFLKKLEEKKETAKDAEAFERALARLVTPVKDKTQFIGEMMKAMRASSGKDGLKDSELTELKIDGDSATAIMVDKSQAKKFNDKEKGTVEIKERRETVNFRKDANGWKMEFVMNFGLGKK